MPLSVLITSAIIGNNKRFYPNKGNLGYFTLLCIGVVGFACLFYSAFEKQTSHIRDWGKCLFGKMEQQGYTRTAKIELTKG